MKTGIPKKTLMCALVLISVLGLWIGKIQAKADIIRLSLTADATYTNAQLAGYNVIELNGHKLTVTDNFTTSASITLGTGGVLTVNGSCVCSGTIYTSGGTVYIYGDYTQRAGKLYLYGSPSISITGDMLFIETGGTGWSSDNALQSGTVHIDGDLIYDTDGPVGSYNNFVSYLVKGDVIQKKTGSTGFRYLGAISLCGSSKQILSLQEKDSIRSLTIENTDVVVTEYLSIRYKLCSDFTPQLPKGVMKSHGLGEITGCTLTINGDFMLMDNLDASFASSPIIRSGGKLIVNGNVQSSGSISNNGGEIIVDGTYEQTGGVFSSGSSSSVTHVKSDFSINGSGRLNNSSGTLTIDRNLYSNSGNGSKIYLKCVVGGNVIQQEDSGRLEIYRLVLLTPGSTLDLPNGKITTLELAAGKSHYNIVTGDVWNNLIATCSVSFDPMGGSCSFSNKNVTTKEKYGELPTATWPGYIFDGWYTAADDGDLIKSTTTVGIVDDQTLFAHWTRDTDPNSLVKAFVTRLYRVFLDRDPDDDGLNGWTEQIVSGRITASEAAAGFIFSPEFINRNLCNSHFIDYLYRGLFNRSADDGGKADWMTRISEGYSREMVAQGFLTSPEFIDLCESYGVLCGTGLSDIPAYGTVQRAHCTIAACPNESPIVELVTNLYRTTLDREPEEEGLAFWVKNVADHAFTGRFTVNGFVTSEEYSNKGKSNAEYITDLYHAIFGRDPDEEGFRYWLDRMNNEGLTREGVLNGFTGSPEFILQCNNAGIEVGSEL